LRNLLNIFFSISLVIYLFSISFVKAEDIEDLERQLERKELEDDFDSRDIIDEIELKKELENLDKKYKPPKECKPIVKTKTIYKTVPSNCKEVKNYYITKKYSLYDAIIANKDNINLTYNQIRKIEEIHRRLSEKILDRKAKINIIKRKLNIFIKRKNITAIRSSLIQIARLKLEISFLDIVEYMKTMEILTDKQKKLLEKLIEW